MRTVKYVLSSLLLGVMFSLLFLLCLTFVSTFEKSRMVSALSYVLPVALGFVVCVILNGKKICFNKRNVFNKVPVRRFLIRVITAVVLLAVGYFISVTVKYGGGTILPVVTNFFFYILVAEFLISFSVFEYIFVPVQ